MGEVQACKVSLDAASSPLPRSVLALPQHDIARRNDPLLNGRNGQESSLSSQCGGQGGTSFRMSLERTNHGDESSVPPLETSRNDCVHGFGQYPIYDFPDADGKRNFVTVSSKQHFAPPQNGLSLPPLTTESARRIDPQMVSRGNNWYPAGFQYTQKPTQAGCLDENLVGVLAELEREREKNAELQRRLKSLEAQIDGDGKPVLSIEHGQKNGKKQRKEGNAKEDGENEVARKRSSNQIKEATIKQEDGEILQVTSPVESTKSRDIQDAVVTWMSRNEVNSADLEKLSEDILSERDCSGDSEEDEVEDEDELNDDEGKENGREKKKSKYMEDAWKARSQRDARCGDLADVKSDAESMYAGNGAGRGQEEDDSDSEGKFIRRSKKNKEGNKRKFGDSANLGKQSGEHDLTSFRGAVASASSYRKAPKTGFCPMEVRRIMESGVLNLPNAQSHTMRKIIVFASLGIRHGCEDLYELDIDHFSVVNRGEPYKSPTEQGEHVLYEYPGGRRNFFYPNRQNSLLCPVQILDEEKAMRPVGLSCPSCLFLCIKYGGRTRNLPQNEYVRQRMGRNKLKSFGPLMCQMALLVHIRSGSFFFKALGITLLFMAGFPNDQVRKETKYRNLDLLQKYYRRDEDCKGENLFHPYPAFFPHAMKMSPVAHAGAIAGKIIGKKGPPPLLSKPSSTAPLPRFIQSISTRPPNVAPFSGLPTAFPPHLPSMSPAPRHSAAAGGLICPPGPPGSSLPPPYGMYPPYPPVQHPAGGFPPWAPGSPYAPGPYSPSTYPYQPFPHPPFVPPYYNSHYQFLPYCPQPGVQVLKQESGNSEYSDSGSDTEKSELGIKVDVKGDNVGVQDVQLL